MSSSNATTSMTLRARGLRSIRSLLGYIALFVAGGIIYYLGYRLALPAKCLTTLCHLWAEADDAIGWVFYPLLAATVYLVALVSRQMMARLGSRSSSSWNAGKYAVVEWLAPLLGLLGTVAALASAMKGLDLSVGMQDAMGELNLKVGQALNSTIYGVSLAIVAGLLRSMTDDRKEVAE